MSPYGYSIAVVAMAAGVRAALAPLLGDHYPLGSFYAAVAVVGWFWGAGPALMSSALGILVGAYFFLKPTAGSSVPLGLEFAAYAAMCTALIALVYRVHERQRRLDAALADHASAQQALAESNARFKRYLDALPDIVFTLNAQGAIDYVNPRWAQYVGPEPFTDEAIEARVAEDDRPALRERREEALRSAERWRIELRLRDRFGALRWFLMRCVPIRNPDDAVLGWVGTAIDIDDERRAADSLELSEQRYRSVSEAFDFGMWSATADGAPLYVGARLLEFLGTDMQEAESRLWSAIEAPAPQIEAASRQWEHCKAAGEPWEWEYSLRGGGGASRRVWSRRLPLRLPSGAITSWVGFNLDVTERYAAGRARDQAHQRLEAVTNAMSVGVAQCNRRKEYVWMNPAYAREIGLSPDQIEHVEGRGIEAVLGPEVYERIEPHLSRALAGETAYYEGTAGIGSDPQRWIHATYTPLWNGETAPVGWVAVVTDLTERRRLEEQLREANHRKDEFLATLAHELRNPLAPIRYATQLLKPGTPPQMANDARQMIDRQLAHMARLLDDLLDVARMTRGAVKIRSDLIDLRSVMRTAVEDARAPADERERHLEIELPDHPLPLRGDEARLVQVIGNLLNNAIKFTGRGGRIVVSADTEGDEITASVRDTGSGIPPELLPHVFEMFVQGNANADTRSGLGIGLALAKQMVDLHGGRIEVHSDGLDRGSNFRITLPRAAEAPAIQVSPADAPNVSILGARDVRVLVVDDNVDAADSLAQLLSIAGYQIRVAYDGRTALEIAGTFQPGVALLDIGLPELDGYELARRLRTYSWGHRLRLIALTGWGLTDDVRKSREAGFDEHFTKPADPQLLLQRIVSLSQYGGPRDGDSSIRTLSQ
jgi:PAS domain S-box-containing protein